MWYADYGNENNYSTLIEQIQQLISYGLMAREQKQIYR